jgi:lipopolysaccharide transport system ATP-binding protein
MARGRIASLPEVGTGFHPEMTGLENIFMNAPSWACPRQKSDGLTTISNFDE